MWRKGRDIISNMKESMGEHILSSEGGSTLEHAHLTRKDFDNELQDGKYAEHPQEIKLKKEMPVPISPKSGISGEYLNEINNFESILDDIASHKYDLTNEIDVDSFARALTFIENKFNKESPGHMRTYIEKFSPTVYTNVVNEKNKEIINMIDNRVAHLYELLGKTWTPALVDAHRADWEEALHVANEITNLAIRGIPSVIKKAA